MEFINKELKNWKREIEEISNNVWRVKITHELGSCIEKTGHNLLELETEIEKSAIEMEKQIENKIKNT